MTPELEAQVQSLRDLVKREERTHADRKAKLAESNDRLKRLRKALAALTDEPAQSSKPRRAEVAPSASGPRPQTVERVFQAFAEHGLPVTPTELARHHPGTLSPQTIQASIPVLRAEGRLRLVGKTRGGGRAWRVVPQSGSEISTVREAA